MGKDSDVKTIGNIEIHTDHVVVSVNPKIYSLDIVYSAAYVFLDKAYVVLDGDPDTEIRVELRFKGQKGDLETLGRDFNNELINYAVYKNESESNRGIKEQIVARALETNSEDDFTDADYLEDPLNIAKPWEELHKNEQSEN